MDVLYVNIKWWQEVSTGFSWLGVEKIAFPRNVSDGRTDISNYWLALLLKKVKLCENLKNGLSAKNYICNASRKMKGNYNVSICTTEDNSGQFMLFSKYFLALLVLVYYLRYNNSYGLDCCPWHLIRHKKAKRNGKKYETE